MHDCRSDDFSLTDGQLRCAKCQRLGHISKGKVVPYETFWTKSPYRDEWKLVLGPHVFRVERAFRFSYDWSLEGPLRHLCSDRVSKSPNEIMGFCDQMVLVILFSETLASLTKLV